MEADMEIDKNNFVREGVDELFLERAFSTPSTKFWYPSPEELIDAGVATHTFDGTDIVEHPAPSEKKSE